MDSLRGARQPARHRGLSRRALSRGRYAHRPNRLRDLLRLAVSEALRQLAANGAEVLVRVSAYMDPWGATEPMSWWSIVNRCRALENTAFVVAANQGASLRHYPPYSWPGGSQIVDFDGRMLAEASPGPGERIVVAPIDISALRHEREMRRGHLTLAHLRTEAYPVYASAAVPASARERARSCRGSCRTNATLIVAS